jgi:hypothetical protein
MARELGHPELTTLQPLKRLIQRTILEPLSRAILDEQIEVRGESEATGLVVLAA